MRGAKKIDNSTKILEKRVENLLFYSYQGTFKGRGVLEHHASWLANFPLPHDIAAEHVNGALMVFFYHHVFLYSGLPQNPK